MGGRRNLDPLTIIVLVAEKAEPDLVLGDGICGLIVFDRLVKLYSPPIPAPLNANSQQSRPNYSLSVRWRFICRKPGRDLEQTHSRDREPRQRESFGHHFTERRDTEESLRGIRDRINTRAGNGGVLKAKARISPCLLNRIHLCNLLGILAGT